MSRLALAYLLLAVILLGEIPVFSRRRRDGAVRRDCGSVWLFFVFLSVGFSSAFQWRRWPLGPWSLWVGAPLTLGGTALRLWAVGTLGRYFTPVVQTSADQPVVQTGPYRWVRHPSYTGSVLAFLGVGLALGTGSSLLCLAAALAPTYIFRIRVEERALSEALGPAYRDYMTRTWRLVPFLI